MALVNWGFLHYMDMKKFLKNFFLQNRLSLRSEKQMDIKLFTEFLLRKNDPSKNMAFMEDSFSSNGTK